MHPDQGPPEGFDGLREILKEMDVSVDGFAWDVISSGLSFNYMASDSVVIACALARISEQLDGIKCLIEKMSADAS